MKRLLFVPNWIGDSVLALPALQMWQREHPGEQLDIVVKSRVKALWELVPGLGHRWVLESGVVDTITMGLRLRSQKYQQAMVLPHAARAAIIARLAGVPERVGRKTTGTSIQDWLLTEQRELPQAKIHQAYEYLNLIAPELMSEKLDLPRLELPMTVKQEVTAPLQQGGRLLIGLCPGAARGPAKRWPAEYYAELGQRLVNELKALVLVIGPGEPNLCKAIARKIGPAAFTVDSGFSFVQTLACLQACRVVVCNDSGPMHLAAALDLPLVAIFGITDPKRTGPLSQRCVLLQKHTDEKSRIVKRDSKVAQTALMAVKPTVVFEHVQRLMGYKG